MPIQLDKILSDIADEKVLHPSYPDATKKDMDDAWTRVGKNNKLSVHEARSIFKVLQKKYEQERQKEKSAWKLFNIMDQIHQKIDVKPPKDEQDADLPMEEDEEYEMLEVQEEDEQHVGASATNTSHASAGNSTGGSGASTSDSDSPPAKATAHNKAAISPADSKEEKPQLHTLQHKTAVRYEKKVLNSQLPLTTSATPTRTPPSAGVTGSAATAAALHKKGITMKKATTAPATGSGAVSNGNAAARNSALTAHHNTSGGGASTSSSSGSVGSKGGATLLELGKTIQLPESIKRKLNEDQHSNTTAAGSQPTKKLHLGSGGAAGKTTAAHTATTPVASHQHNNSSSSSTTAPVQVKQERIEPDGGLPSHGINIITIPAHPANGGGGGPSSSTAATIASTATSTNGYSPTRLEHIDYHRNDIISFDAGNTLQQNGPLSGRSKDNLNNSSGGGGGTGGGGPVAGAGEIINLGNFDNSLPPTFFKNLCNSSRHEALGLYVANVMNRLRSRSAAKLEVAILRAIIDIQSDELE